MKTKKPCHFRFALHLRIAPMILYKAMMKVFLNLKVKGIQDYDDIL